MRCGSPSKSKCSLKPGVACGCAAPESADDGRFFAGSDRGSAPDSGGSADFADVTQLGDTADLLRGGRQQAANSGLTA